MLKSYRIQALVHKYKLLEYVNLSAFKNTFIFLDSALCFIYLMVAQLD